jgi:hypothetical protein
VDDCTVDSREVVVRERYPQVDVVRNPVPTGGPPSMWPLCRLGLKRALDRYDFAQWVKIDTDSLVVGPSFSQVMLERIAAESDRPGVAGCYDIRADGLQLDYRWHAAVLAREESGDAILHEAAERARARGWREGALVHGGVLAVTAPACRAIAAEGWLDWRHSWSSLINEELPIAVFACALGFELVSIGGPDGVIASANKHLPIPKEVAADDSWVAVHSIRHGLAGESESELRAFFRARRQSWPRVSGSVTRANL